MIFDLLATALYQPLRIQFWKFLLTNIDTFREGGWTHFVERIHADFNEQRDKPILVWGYSYKTHVSLWAIKKVEFL